MLQAKPPVQTALGSGADIRFCMSWGACVNLAPTRLPAGTRMCAGAAQQARGAASPQRPCAREPDVPAAGPRVGRARAAVPLRQRGRSQGRAQAQAARQAAAAWSACILLRVRQHQGLLRFLAVGHGGLDGLLLRRCALYILCAGQLCDNCLK